MGKFVSKKIKMRSVARLAAVQAAYMINYSGAAVDEVVEGFKNGSIGGIAIKEDLERNVEEAVALSEMDKEYFTDLVVGMHKNKEEIEKSLNLLLEKDYSFDRFDGTLQSLFLCAVYEIVNNTELDPKVIIQEYVDIAYAFYTKKEPKMVNAVLDKVAKTVR